MPSQIASPAPDPAAEEAKIYTEIHRVTWKRRTAGLLAGATMGVGFGTLIGAAAAFLPWALGALSVAGAAAVLAPGIGAVMAAAGLFAAIGGGIGIVIGSDVGAAAGSVTAGLTRTEPASRPGQKAQETAKGLGEYTNWKVGLACTGIFAAFGALLALNPVTSVALLAGNGAVPLFAGIASAAGAAGGYTAASIAASSSVLGLFGATMGLNFPLMSAQLSNWYTKLITGKFFDKAAAPEADVARASPQQAISRAPGLTMQQGAEVAQNVTELLETGYDFAHASPSAGNGFSPSAGNGFSPSALAAERVGKGVSPQAVIAAREEQAQGIAGRA